MVLTRCLQPTHKLISTKRDELHESTSPNSTHHSETSAEARQSRARHNQSDSRRGIYLSCRIRCRGSAVRNSHRLRTSRRQTNYPWITSEPDAAHAENRYR